MFNRFKHFICGTAALLGAITLSEAQTGSPTPASSCSQRAPDGPQAKSPTSPALPTAPSAKTSDNSPLTLVQASTTNPAPPPTTTTTNDHLDSTTTDPSEADTATDSGGVGVREFQGDDVGQVLRLLARQAKINMVVSEAVVGTVTMRLEDVTAIQAIAIIVKAKGLFMDQIDNVYYIKTPAEKTAEPTESDTYQFSYARAKETAPLLAAQLSSKDAPQVDERTNTIFYRETRSNIENIRKLLVQIDKPTKQVMIEARLVEVTGEPKAILRNQLVGRRRRREQPANAQIRGKPTSRSPRPRPSTQTACHDRPGNTSAGQVRSGTGKLIGADFFFDKLLNPLAGQFAILSAPQMSVTLSALE